MIQPKYKLGQEVLIPLKLENSLTKYVIVQEVKGIVRGISYDPMSGTQGGPYYTYSVLPIGAKQFFSIAEHLIVEMIIN